MTKEGFPVQNSSPFHFLLAPHSPPIPVSAASPPSLWPSHPPAQSPCLPSLLSPASQHFSHSLAGLFLSHVFISIILTPLCETDWVPSLSLPSLPLSSPVPAALPPRPTWPTAVPMVVSRVRPRGLEGVEDSFGQPGPAWTAVWAAYTIVFIPLSSGLYSSKALHFFLWVSKDDRGGLLRWRRRLGDICATISESGFGVVRYSLQEFCSVVEFEPVLRLRLSVSLSSLKWKGKFSFWCFQFVMANTVFSGFFFDAYLLWKYFGLFFSLFSDVQWQNK